MKIIDKEFLIFSKEHSAYWRPKGRGYTTSPKDAGKFTINQCHRMTRHSGPEKMIEIRHITRKKITNGREEIR